MANLPIRDLGSVGVITDVDPFSLPLNAFTRAKNVRFDTSSIRRSPGFRDVATLDTVSTTNNLWIAVENGQAYVAVDSMLAGINGDVYEASFWNIQNADLNNRLIGDINDDGVVDGSDHAILFHYIRYYQDQLTTNLDPSVTPARKTYIETVLRPYMLNNINPTYNEDFSRFLSNVTINHYWNASTDAASQWEFAILDSIDAANSNDGNQPEDALWFVELEPGRPLADVQNSLTNSQPKNLGFQQLLHLENYIYWTTGKRERKTTLTDDMVDYIEDLMIPYLINNPSTHGGFYSSNSYNPYFAYGLYNAAGYDTVTVVDDEFTVYEINNGVVSVDYEAGASQNNNVQITATSLANVTYLNREDNVPLYKSPAMSSFAPLINWPTGYTCASLRSYGDFLIALNTSEAGSAFPTRVRFSDIALANNPPSSWDETDVTKSAGFNDLAQMTTPIIDGQTLGSNFLIYSSDQVWLMEFVGGTFIFNFRKLFNDAGIINQNCAVEVEGKHYVFDQDDIYVTDGVSLQSIVDGRVKDYIFSGIDTSAYNRCFVQFDQSREEVYFCYKSSDDMSEFTNSIGCNRAAVFNYRGNTWSFMDLPNVVSGTSANVATVTTYDSTDLTYDIAGGTFASQEAGFDRHTLMLGLKSSEDGLTSNVLYGLDGIDENSALTVPLNTVATKDIFIERIGIDLDEQQIPLTGYKNIRKMVPQFSTVASDKTFNVSMGAADLATDVPVYDQTYNFDTSTEYKIDSRSAGRYLSYKIETDTKKDFAVSGFDFDVVATGRR